MKGKRLLKLAAIFAIALAMLVALISCKEDDSDRNDEYDRKLTELTLEKRDLMNQIYHINNGEREAIGHNSYMSFLFLSADVGIYNDILPTFEEGDMKLIGTICFSEDELPGMEGNISVEQYEELKTLGWSCALYWTGAPNEDSEAEIADLAAFLDNMRASLSRLDIEMPDSILFGVGRFSLEYDELLESYGIKNAIHDGEDEPTPVSNDKPDGIWHSSAIGWRDPRATRLKAYIELHGGFSSFKVGFDNSEESYATSYYPIDGESTLNGVRTEVFARMIAAFKLSLLDGKIHVNTVSGTRVDMEKYFYDKEKYAEDSKKRKDELNAMIADVENRIFALYEEYFG